MKFADPLDAAQALEQQNIARAIHNATTQGRELDPNGSCHFCGELVEGDKLFCDIDCSSDYEKLRRNRP